jgi:hypothetical protein
LFYGVEYLANPIFPLIVQDSMDLEIAEDSMGGQDDENSIDLMEWI